MTTETDQRDRTTTRETDTSWQWMAGAAAAGAAIGILALLGRKAAVQAPSALAGDWQTALVAEHRAVIKLFDAIQATEDSATLKRTMLLGKIKFALSKHAIEEENVIYPALREAGEIAGADELTAEHGYVKQYLYELENMPKNGPDFLAKIARFRKDIEEHVAEEEDNLFPSLHRKLGADKNKELTLKMNREGFKLA